ATAAGPLWPWRGFRLRAMFTASIGRALLLSLALLSRTFVALSLFRSLLPVMTHQPLPYTALLDPRDHILQTLIDLRIVDESSKGALAAVHLAQEDRKSTRLNSSHEWISYAVFCLKKKNRIAHVAWL